MGVAAGGRAPAVPRNTAGRPFLPRRVEVRHFATPGVSLDEPPSAPYQGGMRRSGRWCTVLLGTLVSCASPSRSEPPARFTELPWSSAPAVASGEPERGLAIVEAVLREHPRHVDGQRLRQDVLRQRGRRGLLLHEAQQAVARSENDPLAHYLLGRIAIGREAGQRSFQRAIEIAPDSLWPWLGAAHGWRSLDPPRAAATYERLYAATGAHPLVAIPYGALLRELERYDDALAVYEALERDPRVPGAGQLGRAQVCLTMAREAEAWRALLEAVRARPADPTVHALVHNWMQSGGSAERLGQVFDVLREDPERLAAFGRGDGVLVLAELLQRTLQPLAAIRLLGGVAGAERQPALRRLLRRSLLAQGDVAGFLALVRQDVPRQVVAAESNQLRSRWLVLLDGPWHAGDPLESAEQGVVLLRALLHVGFVAEAEQLAEVVLQRWPAAGQVEELRAEARRELAFEAGIRRVLYQGYRDGEVVAVAKIVRQIRELSQRIFGRDVVGAPHRFFVPLVGEMQDPFAGGLAEHLDRYNRHFVLGRRAGGVPEGMMFTRLSLAELGPQPALPLAGRCFEVVTIDRDVRALSGVVGGDIAGVALLNHFLVDHDAVREWARTVADRRRIAAADGGALMHDPLPAGVGDDPLDVSWRLSLVSPVQDADLEAAVLDTIRHHERQHLVDSFHYLPIEGNLARGLWLLLRFGLSPLAIQAEMERRAELAALACSPHTELVLAHIADFLGEVDADSPHHRGFQALAVQLNTALQRQGVVSELAHPSRWHLVDPTVVRAAAGELLAELR
jgi:tetratricopeptide (TPR) repeat protein